MIEQEYITRKGKPLSDFAIALTQAQAEVEAKRLAVLQHPTRMRIVKVLKDHPDDLCVFELAKILAIKLGCISYHLRKLRDAKLIYAVRHKEYGTYLYYQVDLDALAQHQEAVHAL